MAQINEHYLKLKAGYLFPEIARRVKAYAADHPQAKIIRMGIGDVTEPLAPAVDDLGVVVDAEDPRHQPGRIPRELQHRERVALGAADAERLVADRHAAFGQGAFGDQVEQAVVDHAQPAAVAQVAREAPEPGVAQGLLRMAASARSFDTKRVSSADLAWVAAGAESAD